MSDHIDHVPSPADAETGSFDDEVTPEALNFAASLFWAFSILALAVLPLAVEKGRRDLGWFQEPWSWPFIVLSAGLVGGAVQPWRLWALRKGRDFATNLRGSFDGMGRSLVYSLTFLVYLGGVALLGFTVASVIYMQVLYWISGLRGGKWPLIALLVALGIVAAFRVGLGIWFPYPPLLQILPDWVGNTLGDYL